MELDATIKQVERLYHTVTGHDMPPMDPKRAAIPPERDVVKHVEEQLARLDQALGGLETSPSTQPAWTPRVSFWETEDTLFVCVNLPGVKRNDVRMTLVGQSVVVEGRRNLPTALANADPRQVYGEDAWGAFRREIPLPVRVDAGDVDAKLQDGLLTVKLKQGKPAEENERVIPVN